MIVAIDGPAGAGKSTIARRLAERLGYLYIDTGAMYRAVAVAALRAGVPLEDAASLALLAESVDLPLSEEVREAIRRPEVGQAASKVSAHPQVRAALVRKQQAYGARQPVVMEGRDIGSVVFPNAAVKVFLDAEPEERVRRRVEDLRAQGQPADPGEVAQALAERDQRDSTRAAAPLRLAPGARRVDTTNLTIEQVEERILAMIREALTS
jgi:cytidylate kinase